MKNINSIALPSVPVKIIPIDVERPEERLL